MVKTDIDFQHSIFTQALVRTRAGMNLWGVKIKQGVIPTSQEYRTYSTTVQEIESLHPLIAKARSQELKELLDCVFDEVFDVFCSEMGSLKAIALLTETK